MVLSSPEIRGFIQGQLAGQLETLYGKPDLIVGVATGAIGIGMLVADTLELPFAYVRPKPKEHGRQNQIEGRAEAGQSAVVIEDLISTGNSSLKAVEALRAAGIEVKGMLGIFSYGFEIADENFAAHNLSVHTLSNYEHLIDMARSSGYIKEKQMKTLRDWRANPQQWNS